MKDLIGFIYHGFLSPAVVFTATLIGINGNLLGLLIAMIPAAFVSINIWISFYGGREFLSQWLHPVLLLRVDGQK